MPECEKDRSARYHLSPDKSQRLFNLLAKRKGAKDREVAKGLVKQANPSLAPRYDLAQHLTNAGFDPEEVAAEQYVDPYNALRLSPLVREWAQRGDLNSLSGVAAGEQTRRDLIDQYADKGWGDARESMLGAKGLGALERFGINALQGGSQLLDQDSLTHGFQTAQAQLAQKLQEQGLDEVQAFQKARLLMPNEEAFRQQVADRLYSQGVGGGAINMVSPFLTSYALPLNVAWNAYRTMGGDAARGFYGDDEAQAKAEALFEASQRAADARGGPNFFRDLYSGTLGMPVGYAAGLLGLQDPTTATIDAARGLRGLTSGGMDYTDRKREETLRNLRRAHDQWNAANLTETQDQHGLRTGQGVQAGLSRQGPLAITEGGQAINRAVEAEKVSPYRNLFGTFDGLPAYLWGGRDKSEYEAARGDVTGTGLNVFAGGATNPLVAWARNARDTWQGQDTTYDRMRELRGEGDPRLKAWQALHNQAERGKFDLNTLNQVEFGHRGGAENMPWYMRVMPGVDENKYGARAGVQVDTLLGSDSWKNWMQALRSGQAAAPQVQQLQAWANQLQQSNPEVYRMVSRELQPNLTQYQANKNVGQAQALAGDYQKIYERFGSKPAGGAQPAGQPPQVPNQMAQPGNIPNTKTSWAKMASEGFVTPSDAATGVGPIQSVGSIPNIPSGPLMPGGVQEIRRRISTPAIPYPGGDRVGWAGRRRQAATDLYRTAPENRRQYYGGLEERWARPYFIPGSFRGALSDQDVWSLDPVIQRHREALMRGEWEPGMQIDRVVNRGTLGWTNPLGTLSRFFGYANPEAESEYMLKQVRKSPQWSRLLKQYEEGLISRDQLQQLAPGALARLQTPDQAIASIYKSEASQIQNKLREAAEDADVRTSWARQANPLGAS